MYESFFGFKEKPFNITPDPKYLYLSGQHQEAIAHLLYGIRERGGFVVITGEIGTGKTTLCRYLINEIDDRTEGAIIFNPNLSEIELLKSINEDFGIISTGQTKKELIDELNQFLLEKRLRGKNIVLIIDEAQNLQPVVLEQIRMLSNLETEKEKLIQLILIGQPQLKRLLARPELRQLDQRVTARYHLDPLNRNETCEYIQHRLDVASNGSRLSFEPAAMKQVYKFSKGTPRLINVVCDRALLGAFAAGQQGPVTRKLVKQAIREVAGERFSLWDRLSLDRSSAKVLAYAIAVAVVAGLGLHSVANLLSARKNSAPQTELIPDAPPDVVAKSSALFQPARTEAAPPRATGPGSAVREAPSPSQPISLSQEHKNALTDALLSKNHEQSRVSAVRGLLSLWGISPDPAMRNVGNFYSVAMSYGMRCTELWTNFEGLRSFNAPCVLEMFVPQEFKPRYVVLLGLGTNNAKIICGDSGPVVMPLELLDESWLRRAFVFWKDFENLGEAIMPGKSGAEVAWLQTSLQTLDFYGGPVNGAFDDATESAVRQFQQSNNLLLDGIVGPKTKLALYGNLGAYSMPRLNDKTI
ncbi:AAA family ATPase [Candidatus Poribacteria bacterium]|nr:AAA family ATPase [Candidatus Poribacteria bacterium]